MKSHIRRIFVFLLAVVVVQGLALLFMTPRGLEKLYPIPLRIAAEKFKPENNTYAVYYNTRVEISDADLIVVGIDAAVAESYDLLGHFSRFLKQYNNLSDVLLDFDRVSERIAAGIMNETSESKFYAKLETLQRSSGLSEDYCDYLSELFVINTTMAPTRKFKIESYSSGSPEDSALSERIALAYADCERSALCVVDVSGLEQGSTFRKELDALLPEKKILYLQTLYTANCPLSETHSTIAFPLCGNEPTFYFTENEKLAPFYAYYNRVAGLSEANRVQENRLDTRFTDYFFIVANGTESKYIEFEETAES